MGDPKKTVSSDDEDEAFGSMSEGRSALKKGNLNRALMAFPTTLLSLPFNSVFLIVALEKLTEAIEKNPQNAIFFATRYASRAGSTPFFLLQFSSAEILVELKRPNAAIRDATRAIELNPGTSIHPFFDTLQPLLDPFPLL